MRARILAVLGTMALAACGSATPSSTHPEAQSVSHVLAQKPALGGVPDPASFGRFKLPDVSTSNSLVVQEWGTFTSVQASDGHMLAGLHHEDETLPSFVERRNWSDRQNYYFEDLPEEPLQQLETPVLYFWSKEARDVEVRVDFPEGVIGQWYPSTQAFAPELGSCTSLSNGWMSWSAHVDPAVAVSSFPEVSPDEIWAPSRNVASTPLTVDGQAEQFIFYRGLGMFQPDVKVTQTLRDTLDVTNHSGEDLPAVFLLRVTADGGAFVPMGSLAAGQVAERPLPMQLSTMDDYLASARSGLKDALVASGLFDDVAQAMVDTWTRSWFKNEGVRVLYVAPHAWTDRFLPTTITPTPDRYVRTFVGRIETLRPADELNLSDQLQQGLPPTLESLGRFAEPRLRRALENMSNPAEVEAANSLLAEAHALP